MSARAAVQRATPKYCAPLVSLSSLHASYGQACSPCRRLPPPPPPPPHLSPRPCSLVRPASCVEHTLWREQCALRFATHYRVDSTIVSDDVTGCVRLPWPLATLDTLTTPCFVPHKPLHGARCERHELKLLIGSPLDFIPAGRDTCTSEPASDLRPRQNAFCKQQQPHLKNKNMAFETNTFVTPYQYARFRVRFPDHERVLGARSTLRSPLPLNYLASQSDGMVNPQGRRQ